MTLIAVFSDKKGTHLIADSLITHEFNRPFSGEDYWLSTGIKFQKDEVTGKTFSEGKLKIWPIQKNLSIGYAGDVQNACNLLELILNRKRSKRFENHGDLFDFISTVGIKGIGRVDHPFELCGFIGEKDETVKFKISVESNSNVIVTCSVDQDTPYVIGSGESVFNDLWNRKPSLFDEDIDPTLVYSIFADHIYMDQFLGKKELITNKYIGGAITGIYYSNGITGWQPPRSIVAFANIGGTGLKCKFVWLPLVYKTWAKSGNVFSLSMFEQDGSFYLKLIQYSNAASKPISLDEIMKLEEIKTFNSKQTISIMLPKGLTNKYPAILKGVGKLKAFDELIENEVLAGVKLNKEYFRQLSNSFFVNDDFTISIGFDRLPALVKELRKNLDSIEKEKWPLEWSQRQNELAVRLMEFGGKTNDIETLAEAFSRFLLSHQISCIMKLDNQDEIKKNIDRFIDDLSKNIDVDGASRVIEVNQSLYKEFMSICEMPKKE